jgi:hypothetical protein
MPVTIDEVIAEVAPPVPVPPQPERGAEPTDEERRDLVRTEMARMERRALRLHAD